MPQVLELNISAKLNGKPIQGFPYYRRIQVDEAQQFTTEQANGIGYTTLPITSIDTVQALVLTPSQPVTVRFAGQSDAGLSLAIGGLLIIIDGSITGSASTNVTINNTSGNTAILDGLAGGT